MLFRSKGPEDANSAGQRQKLIEWFQSVWLTRAEPGVNGSCGAAQVVVLTRWDHQDVIGWLHEMQQLTTQDALDWYHTYYAPNNAALIVAGDITMAEPSATSVA